MRRSRRNTLVGGIVALGLVLAGTGYAYWTDSLNVTTKATTGDFGVKFVDLGLYGQYGDETMKGAGWSIVDGIGDTGYVGDQWNCRASNAAAYRSGGSHRYCSLRRLNILQKYAHNLYDD